MQKQRFAEIIKNPYLPDMETTKFLEELCDKYPYCQIAQIILAKCYQENKSALFEKQVNLASAYSIDRHQFQNYISEKNLHEKNQGRHEYFSGQQDTESIPATDDNENLAPTAGYAKHEDETPGPGFRQYEEEIPGNKINKDDGKEDHRKQLEKIVSNRLKSLKSRNSEGKKEAPVIPTVSLSHKDKSKRNSRSDEIIEKFICKQPRISSPKKTGQPKKDLSSDSVQFNDDIISETLAEIYLKQGKIDSALNIYNKLSLKFPEKSSIFAKKIKQVKKTT